MKPNRENDSSVLFNLREIMQLEQDRVQEEEASRQRQEAEAQRRREELEARRRAEAAARVAEEQRLRDEEERRRRDEEERRRRDIEESELRIRYEAEARARAEDQERLLRHEREVAALAAQKRKGIHPGAVAAVVLVLVGGSVGAYFGAVKPLIDRSAREAEVARLHALQVAREAEAARRQVEEESRKRQQAEEMIRTKAAQRPAPDNSVARAADGLDDGSTGGRRRKVGSKAVSPAKSRAADSDDPLAGLENL